MLFIADSEREECVLVLPTSSKNRGTIEQVQTTEISTTVVEQRKVVSILSHELSEPNHYSNWLYKIL